MLGDSQDWASPITTSLAIFSLSVSLMCASTSHYVFFKCCDLSLTPSLLLPGTGPSRFWMSYFLCVHQHNGCCAAYFRLHPTSCSSTSPPVLLPSILGCWTGRQVCSHRLSWPSSFPVGDAKNELVSLDVLSSPPSSCSLFSQYHNSSVF